LASLTLELAARAAKLAFCDIPPSVRSWACRAFADTVACGIAGGREEAVALISALLPSTDDVCTLLGGTGKTNELDAAQINGVAAHVLDFDDCHIEMDGHPSVSLVPALLAMGERLGCSGEDILTAYVAAIEAEIRIARLSNPEVLARGWHPTAIFGTMGGAIAVGHLLQLSPEKMAVAMGIAASSAAGLRANSGTMTKSLHAGQANRNGLQAALLASQGFSACENVLEQKFGFLAAFSGKTGEETEALLADWGHDFALLSPGIAIKQYPCCAFTHCAIEAAIALRAKVTNNEIELVEVALHHSRLSNIDRPRPRDGMDAKFSTQYLTARALLAGHIQLSDFEEPCLSDPATYALAARVRLLPHHDADISLGRIRVQLANGHIHTATASVAMGYGPTDPMAESKFRAKFDDCVKTVLSPLQATLLYEKLMSLPVQSSLRSLTSLMQPCR